MDEDTVAVTRPVPPTSLGMPSLLEQGTIEQDSSSDDLPASTPPTSVNEASSTGSAMNEPRDASKQPDQPAEQRSRRSRTKVSSYNLKKLANAQDTSSRPSSSRNVSGLTGHTLVASEEEDEERISSKLFGDKLVEAWDMDWEMTPGAKSTLRRSPRKIERAPSMKDRVKKAASKVGSVLGKRGRDMMETGKRGLRMHEASESPKQTRILKQLDLGKGGVLDEIDLEVDMSARAQRPAKRAKTGKTMLPAPSKLPDTPLQKTSNGRKVKKWEKQGLYVGQLTDNVKLPMPKNSMLRSPGSSSSATMPEPSYRKPRKLLTMPMFNYLEKTRDFIIPFDIYAPTAKRGDEKPKDWAKVNRNRLVGDAKELWEGAEKLPTSACVCSKPGRGELGCGEDCLNRVMQYECNSDNCSLDRDTCGNRAFADLLARTKKGGAYDIGVEVVKTNDRGFGVRSCRSFAPGQIIMEYTGEVISEGECQRRMREDYQNKQCYYLMELERGLIIDGTKGSMARFINHSCAPNCEVRMMKVNGIPRMAVFAGDDGIMTGEELTYDYNFDNFGTTQQKCYCGAPTCRGFLSKRLNAVEQKKMLKEEAEKSRRALEEAQKRAEAEAKKKQIQANRGSGWRGWVAVDDPEVKERLREEKKAKEQAASTSDRAMRLAARRNSLPSQSAPIVPAKAKRDADRRKTENVRAKPPALSSVRTAVQKHGTASLSRVTQKRGKGKASVSSKFTEQLSRSSSPQINVSAGRRKSPESNSGSESETINLIDHSKPLAEPRPSTSESTLSRTMSKGKGAIKTVSEVLKQTKLNFAKHS